MIRQKKTKWFILLYFLVSLFFVCLHYSGLSCLPHVPWNQFQHFSCLSLYSQKPSTVSNTEKLRNISWTDKPIILPLCPSAKVTGHRTIQSASPGTLAPGIALGIQEGLTLTPCRKLTITLLNTWEPTNLFQMSPCRLTFEEKTVRTRRQVHVRASKAAEPLLLLKRAGKGERKMSKQTVSGSIWWTNAYPEDCLVHKTLPRSNRAGTWNLLKSSVTNSR